MKSFLAKLNILLILLFYVKTTAAATKQSEPILSGVRASPGEYPWHVLIKKESGGSLLGGGSVISNTWVLTAAHCLKNKQTVFMQFGTVEFDSNALGMTSTRLIIHPQFNPRSYVNDVGLVELPTPLTYNTFIQPIALVTSSEAANTNFTGVVTFLSGYGYYDDKVRKLSPWLLWGSEKVVYNSVCAETLGPMEDSQMCTVGYTIDKQNPCKGDSGGPLVWRNPSRKLKQIAVFSFGRLRNCLDYPAGYVRVASFLDYIRNVTGVTPE
ncbi:collagenase-like [Lucilia sericata]|uniref:collagenase-like n=1 Tax=Lucilia sericata TaxID=13632 RepID=UPI0018A80B72|nr:collagenase-like [Lucilia sericata]